jgi:hypothetical protein
MQKSLIKPRQPRLIVGGQVAGDACIRPVPLILTRSWPKQTKLKQDLLRSDGADAEYQQKKAHIRNGAGRLQDQVTVAQSR